MDQRELHDLPFLQDDGRVAIYATKEKDEHLFHHSFSLRRATITLHSKYRSQVSALSD